MITLSIINKKTRQHFEKEFENAKEAKRFILRCRYGNNLFIESISTESNEAKNELAKIW